ncbi:MAG: hypothetical protein ACOYOT_07160 [Bacteroidales bacterium]
MAAEFHQYKYHESKLMAVPAVHHQSAFATQVHTICRNEKLRPDAIAVELGHSVVMELVKFLKELKQGGTKKVNLPIMLGLMTRNKYIHPDYIERSLLLQELYRLPLYHLPNDVLSDRLEFSKWSSYHLSPTDSIIEAIRCAIELDIPVYGVDLSDFGFTRRKAISIEDSHSAHDDSIAYGKRIMKYSDAVRDQTIDINRETFMVAGLKHCLTNHNKVLFTCGMAHWKSIVNLLDDSRVLPFPVYEISEGKEFERVIIHPTLASSHMFILPQLTFDYEANRYPVTVKNKNPQTIDPEKLIRTCLDEVYTTYTSDLQPSEFNLHGSASWINIGQYEQYLYHLTAIRQLKIPDFHTMLTAADGMMDDTFCRILSNQIMDVNPTWTSPNDFPKLPVISPSDSTEGHKEKRSNRRTKVMVSRKSNKKRFQWDESEFYTSMPNESGIYTNDINKKWKWSSAPKNKKNERGSHGSEWIWPPCESLLYGLAYKAAEISRMNQNRFNQSSAFDGSLEGGIDVKATMRSIIRNERKIYVSKLNSGLEQSIFDGINPDPFVFIFPETTDLKNADWNFFIAGSDLKNHVKDKELFEKITKEQGDVHIASILIGEQVEAPEQYKKLFTTMSRTYGTVMFGNPCINVRQSVIWLESSRYKCCPIVFSRNLQSILEYYEYNFNIEIDLENWEEALIRMAIPFAKKEVTIIAGDEFRFTERVRVEAERKRVSLNVVSYSNFSTKQLEEARNRFIIKTLDKAGLQFPPETEIILGQTKETYFEMLPYAIRKQVGYVEK